MAIGQITFSQPQAYSGGADFSQLANLGNVYREAQNRERLSELGKQLASGTINYQQAAGQVADMGDMKSTLAFLGLSEEQKKLARQQAAAADLNKKLGVLYGPSVAGGEDDTPAPAGPKVAAAVPVVATDPNAPIRTNPDGTLAGNIATQPVTQSGPTQGPVVQGGPVQSGATQPPRPASPPPVAPSDNQKKIAFLLQSSLNPDLDEKSRGVVGTLLNKALDEAKPIERMQLLQAYKDSDPSLADKSLFQIEMMMRKQSAPTMTVEQKGESAEQTEGAKALTKRFEKLSEAGDVAQNRLAMLSQMRELRQQFATGGPAAAQAWLASNGIKVGKNVSQVEAYNALIQRATPNMRPLGSGATSDYEEKMYRSALPQLINTPGGNDIIDATMTAEAEHQLELARISEQALSREISHKEAIQKMRDIASPYQKFMMFRANNYQPWPADRPAPAFPRSEAEMKKLKSGTEFFDPTGTLRKVP